MHAKTAKAIVAGQGMVGADGKSMIAVTSPEQLEQTICLSGCLRPAHPSCIPVFQLFQAFAISRSKSGCEPGVRHE